MKQTQVKVVLLGDSGVGKSSLLYRYVMNTFEQERHPTMGASFMSKSVQLSDSSIKFNIWDTAGQERYKALAKMYYRDASVAVLVYALDQPQSLLGLQTWATELQTYGPSNVLVAVAANKEDTVKGTDQEGASWALSQGAIYRRTSAKYNTGIVELFEDIAIRLDQEHSSNLSRRSIHLGHRTKTKGGTCCAAGNRDR